MSQPLIELLYNERYESVGDEGHERGPFYDIATVRVLPDIGRVDISVQKPGLIILTREAWEQLVRQVNDRFEEVQQ